MGLRDRPSGGARCPYERIEKALKLVGFGALKPKLGEKTASQGCGLS